MIYTNVTQKYFFGIENKKEISKLPKMLVSHVTCVLCVPIYKKIIFHFDERLRTSSNLKSE